MPLSAKPAQAEPTSLTEEACAYSCLPVRELLDMVRLGGADLKDPEAQVIYTAFYHRYRRYLYTVVMNALGEIYHEEGCQEIVNDALLAFFRVYAQRLTLPQDKSDEECDRILRAYLGQLAKWKAGNSRSFHQTFGRGLVDEDALESHVKLANSGYEGADVNPDAPTEPRIPAIKMWLDGLSDLERDVVQTYFLDDHSGRKSDRLPEGVAPLLAQKHKTTTSNLRHIKLKLEAEFRAKFST